MYFFFLFNFSNKFIRVCSTSIWSWFLIFYQLNYFYVWVTLNFYFESRSQGYRNLWTSQLSGQWWKVWIIYAWKFFSIPFVFIFIHSKFQISNLLFFFFLISFFRISFSIQTKYMLGTKYVIRRRAQLIYIHGKKISNPSWSQLLSLNTT